jgi:hypothetical protein
MENIRNTDESEVDLPHLRASKTLWTPEHDYGYLHDRSVVPQNPEACHEDDGLGLPDSQTNLLSLSSNQQVIINSGRAQQSISTAAEIQALTTPSGNFDHMMSDFIQASHSKGRVGNHSGKVGGKRSH